MRVLFGYDGSIFADEALSDLHRAGLPPDVEMIVLCAADMLAMPTSQDDAIEAHAPFPLAAERNAHMEEALAGARAVAERGAVRLRTEFPRWSTSAEAVVDSPAWAIIKRAEGLGGQPWRADMIIVGAAGHSAIGRILFGSVAHKVLTNARCSTRIARAGRAPGNTPIRLLVGVDGSEDSRAAVSAVARRTWPAGTQCRAMSVTDSRMRLSFVLPVPPVSPETHALRLAREAAETLCAAGLATTPVVKDGEAARCLVNEAEEYGADCVFVGARGLGRVDRFLLGSVSASVAMRASCTVEVIHPAR